MLAFLFLFFTPVRSSRRVVSRKRCFHGSNCNLTEFRRSFESLRSERKNRNPRESRLILRLEYIYNSIDPNVSISSFIFHLFAGFFFSPKKKKESKPRSSLSYDEQPETTPNLDLPTQSGKPRYFPVAWPRPDRPGRTSSRRKPLLLVVYEIINHAV